LPYSREIKLELSTAFRKCEDGKYYEVVLRQVAVQGWMEWWRDKVLPCRAFWPRYRGEHSAALLKTNIPVLAFACEPLLCVLFLLLRA